MNISRGRNQSVRVAGVLTLIGGREKMSLSHYSCVALERSCTKLTPIPTQLTISVSESFHSCCYMMLPPHPMMDQSRFPITLQQSTSAASAAPGANFVVDIYSCSLFIVLSKMSGEYPRQCSRFSG